MNGWNGWNQMEWNGISMNGTWNHNEIKIAKVTGNAQAITYADSEDAKTKQLDRIGIALSTCGQIEALLKKEKFRLSLVILEPILIFTR